MADERKPVLLRLSPELWAELKRWADAELRSANSLVELLLREAVRKRGVRLNPGPAAPSEEGSAWGASGPGSDGPGEKGPAGDQERPPV